MSTDWQAVIAALAEAAPLPYLDPRLTASLDVNGIRVADSGPELAAGVPTVLAGARVTWGRSTVVDQPDAATAAFTLAALTGDSGFLTEGLLDIGSTVQLFGAGSLTAGLDVNTIADPGFEALPVGPLPPSRGVSADTVDFARQVTVTAAPAATGTRALQLTVAARPAAPPAVSVMLPPAPFSPDRTAWDHLPALHYPDELFVSASVRAPAGRPFTVRACAFRTPDGREAAPWANSTQIEAVGTGDWQTFTAVPSAAQAQYAGWWAGVRVSWTAQSWAETPGSWADQSGSWADVGSMFVDDVAVQYTATTDPRDVLIFTGRVTDIDAHAETLAGGPALMVDVIAADPAAELGNVMVGDQPWLTETLGARAARIMTLTGTGIGVQVDQPAAGRRVTWRDVDRQAASGLIRELATSAGAVAWMATHATAAGPYWFLEDPSTRRAGLYSMEMGDDDLVVIVAASAAGPFVELESSRILADPIRWKKSVSDVTTAVDLSWLEQGVDGDGKPVTTERHSMLSADPATNEKYGYRRYGTSTQLALQADADQVALIVYARLAEPVWRVGSLSWDTRVGPTWGNDQTTLALDLLDGQRRLGHPLMVTGLPDWTPDQSDRVPVYVEGGTYTFTGRAWTLDFNVSSAAGQGRSGGWNTLDPAWAWNQLDPAIRWIDMVGVSGPVAP